MSACFQSLRVMLSTLNASTVGVPTSAVQRIGTGAELAEIASAPLPLPPAAPHAASSAVAAPPAAVAAVPLIKPRRVTFPVCTVVPAIPIALLLAGSPGAPDASETPSPGG